MIRAAGKTALVKQTQIMNLSKHTSKKNAKLNHLALLSAELMSWLYIALPFSINATVSAWTVDFITSVANFDLDSLLDTKPNDLSFF